MEENVVVEPVFTKEEYEIFKKIYDDFCFLMDNKNPPVNSKYSYRQARLYQNLEGFWPILKSIFQRLEIECKLSLDELKHIILGFNHKKVFDYLDDDDYEGMPPQKILILLELEEERLKIAAKRSFDNGMVKLDVIFDKNMCIVPNSGTLQTEWITLPLIHFKPLQDIKKKKTKVENTNKSETLSKRDAEILQTLFKHVETAMLKLEIEDESGYGKYGVAQSLKRLEEMLLVCRPGDPKCKGWMLTEKGIAMATKLN